MAAQSFAQIRFREAVERGDLVNVTDELANGADPNQCGSTKWTALHRASDRGWFDIVRVLLQSGATVWVNLCMDTSSKGGTATRTLRASCSRSAPTRG